MELIPAKASESIPIASSITKYLKFSTHAKLIKNDNVIIDNPIAKATE
jgi:hypothetical protein